MTAANPLPALPDTGKARILVVGDVMLDRYWFGEVSRISPEAPVPVVHVQRSEERPGGAANVARNAAALGARCALLSVAGNDEPAQALEKLLQTDGVESHLHRDAGLATTIKLRVLGRQQQLLRIDFENLPAREILQEALEHYETLLPEFDVVVLSDYGKGGLEHIAEMIRMARARGKIVLVDPKGDDYSKYKGANLLTPNRSELRQVVGQWHSESDLVARAQKLREALDLEALLVTRSEEGMSLFRAGGAVNEGTRAQEVFDVSGAGDTVIATLAVMLAAGCDLVSAMRLSNHAAGIVVAKLGTATVTFDEMKKGLA
ncbi:D-glycero-beta-D-manno-heptose-7-phosphate kinase [Uliginosibacterium paludis]|uniref:D-glycero-beta-D-manno-heptose-7-phosphate kinase n=1 Tax=Uliginosibacterium paludis TaxID=1615952 RepID=A0ABV2CL56_9RHOO